MELLSRIYNTSDSLSNGDVAAKMLGAWRQASAAHGLSGKRKVDDRRGVLGMASMSGSGYAYPGVVRARVARPQNGAEHPQDDRETSFNGASHAEESGSVE